MPYIKPNGTSMSGGRLPPEVLRYMDIQNHGPELRAAQKVKDFAEGNGCYYATLPFGKYQGQTLGHVLDIAPNYVLWLDSKCTLTNGVFAEAVHAVADKYKNRFKKAKKL